MLESYGLTLTSGPGSEPVTLAEAKAHIRLEHDADDSLITGLIAAARKMIEQEYGVQMINATWKMTLDRFPSYEITLARGPIQSVTSITYKDSDNVTQTVSASDYLVDMPTKRIWPDSGFSWPSTYDAPGNVSIIYVSGYGTASDVPEPWKLAIKMLVAGWYEQRESMQQQTMNMIPFGVEAICSAVWDGHYA